MAVDIAKIRTVCTCSNVCLLYIKTYILVRKLMFESVDNLFGVLGQGCGFGFRYTHLSHLVPSKVQPTEFGSASLQGKYL